MPSKRTWAYWHPLVIACWLWLCELFLLPILVVPVLMLWARWDKQPSTDSHGEGLTIRGDLPSWARWWSTPDERLPGGTYEPAVAAVLAAKGKIRCSIYWLGLRNRLQGLAFAFAVPAAMPWDPTQEFQQDGDYWFARSPILGGRFVYKRGWRSYLIQGKAYRVPCLTWTKP